MNKQTFPIIVGFEILPEEMQNGVGISAWPCAHELADAMRRDAVAAGASRRVRLVLSNG